MNNINK